MALFNQPPKFAADALKGFVGIKFTSTSILSRYIIGAFFLLSLSFKSIFRFIHVLVPQFQHVGLLEHFAESTGTIYPIDEVLNGNFLDLSFVAFFQQFQLYKFMKTITFL